ncbi:MAG: hypothetical protein K9L68_05755 [Spirochaetales bacterium]|nr:hypothetical protein [Spirochaetales bacterium]MCF7938085.1 hypothetical protein [Spirochaetales bacterium]
MVAEYRRPLPAGIHRFFPRLLRILLLAGAVMTLVTCQGFYGFFFGSNFPAVLSVAEKVWDMSGYLDDKGVEIDSRYDSRLEILNGYPTLQIDGRYVAFLNSELETQAFHETTNGFEKVMGYDFSAGDYIVGNDTYDATFTYFANNNYPQDSVAYSLSANPPVAMYTDSGNGTLNVADGVGGSTPTDTDSIEGRELVDVDIDSTETNLYLFFRNEGGDDGGDIDVLTVTTTDVGGALSYTNVSVFISGLAGLATPSAFPKPVCSMPTAANGTSVYLQSTARVLSR